VNLKSRLGSLKVTGNDTIRKRVHGFIFAIHSSYGSNLSHFDKDRYRSKIGIFPYPLAFDAPIRGSPSEYCHNVWYGKTITVGLSDGRKILRIYSVVLTEYRHVIDGRTYIL